MSILIFILVLVALIVVHEFGHFVVAKLSGMRVDEFGIGYPPRALLMGKIGETEYTLNWLPFGGFVKIYGEDGTEEGKVSPRAFSAKPRILQALVLLAGIGMNLFFAWILLSGTLALGMPRELTPEEAAGSATAMLTVSSVLPGSPAAAAGLEPGDSIVSASSDQGTFSGHSPEAFTSFIAHDTNQLPLILVVNRGGKTLALPATPHTGVVASDVTRPALGVGIAIVGTVPVSLAHAPLQGAVLTWQITKDTAVALVHFFGSILTFSADLSQVAGPVGIAGAVGQASAHGLAPLLYITALISINLALINVIPMPALDGGRLLFVIIEAIIRKPIRQKVANAVNMVGFGLLILLMLVVTAHDVFKIIG